MIVFLADNLVVDAVDIYYHSNLKSVYIKSTTDKYIVHNIDLPAFKKLREESVQKRTSYIPYVDMSKYGHSEVDDRYGFAKESKGFE